MIYDLIGSLGVLLCLIAYFLIQTHRVQANNLTYLLLNLFGALGILISLLVEWNLPAFLMEFTWILISLYGLLSYFKNKRKKLSL
jgi:hypothetical protein